MNLFSWSSLESVETFNLSLAHTPRRGLPNGISAHPPRMRVVNRLRKPYNRQRIVESTDVVYGLAPLLSVAS